MQDGDGFDNSIMGQAARLMARDAPRGGRNMASSRRGTKRPDVAIRWLLRRFEKEVVAACRAELAKGNPREKAKRERAMAQLSAKIADEARRFVRTQKPHGKNKLVALTREYERLAG